MTDEEADSEKSCHIARIYIPFASRSEGCGRSPKRRCEGPSLAKRTPPCTKVDQGRVRQGRNKRSKASRDRAERYNAAVPNRPGWQQMSFVHFTRWI